jgi:hypothetical protein
MLTLPGPMLAAIVLARAPNEMTAAGEVVDDTGKSVADVPAVSCAAPVFSGKEDQPEAQTRTDAGRQFRMKLSAYRRMFIGGINYLPEGAGSYESSRADPRRPLHRHRPLALACWSPAGSRLGPLSLFSE